MLLDYVFDNSTHPGDCGMDTKMGQTQAMGLTRIGVPARQNRLVALLHSVMIHLAVVSDFLQLQVNALRVGTSGTVLQSTNFSYLDMWCCFKFKLTWMCIFVASNQQFHKVAKQHTILRRYAMLNTRLATDTKTDNRILHENSRPLSPVQNMPNACQTQSFCTHSASQLSRPLTYGGHGKDPHRASMGQNRLPLIAAISSRLCVAFSAIRQPQYALLHPVGQTFLAGNMN